MPKILVTGASGFVGKSLTAELFRQDYDIGAAARSTKSQINNAEVVVVGEIDGNTDWTNALRNVDVVIHLAARVHVMKENFANPLAEFRKVNVEGTQQLAQSAANAGVKRFVYISSIGVNGFKTTLPFTESVNPNPHSDYAISKWEAEQVLLRVSAETGLEVVIIRPPLVYGFDAPGNFASMMRVVKRGIPLPFGAIHNKRSFVYVGNLVSFILLCIDHPAAANQTFLISDGHDISTTELLRGCAEVLGMKARLLPFPQKLVEVCATIIGKRDVAQRLCGNLQVDISKARTLLGWAPPKSVADGLKATALG